MGMRRALLQYDLDSFHDRLLFYILNVALPKSYILSHKCVLGLKKRLSELMLFFSRLIDIGHKVMLAATTQSILCV